MSLVIDITVNRFQSVATVAAQRITNTGGRPNDDDVSEYRVTHHEGSQSRECGTLSHRYGDGGLVLAQNSLRLALDTLTPSP